MGEQIRSLEINLISARDLHDVNLVTKMDVYAVVSISGDPNNNRQIVNSGVDRGCGTSPAWNFTARLDVDESLARENRLTLSVRLVCVRSLGDKDVGEVNVPVKELLDSWAGNPHGNNNNNMRFVSYQVIKPSGAAKGELTFSYRFLAGKPAGAGEPPPAPAVAGYYHAHGPPPVTVYAEYPFPSTSAPAPIPVLNYYHVPYGGNGYPAPQTGYGYPVPPYSYGYPVSGPPPPSGYGHEYRYPSRPPPPPQVQSYQMAAVAGPSTNNKSNLGLGLGAGLVGGVLGGLLIGDVVSDVASYDAGFADAGGFGF